jgi:hypothetical protein
MDDEARFLRIDTGKNLVCPIGEFFCPVCVLAIIWMNQP